MRAIIGILSVFLFISCQDNRRTRLDKNAPSSHSQNSVNIPRPLWDSTNPLLPTVQTLHLKYTVWGCWCPQWVRVSDAGKGDEVAGIDKHFWLEPANDSLYYPPNDSTLKDLSWTVTVTGQFYERKSYARGTYEQEEPAPKANVFRYTSIKLLRSKHANSQDSAIQGR